MLQPLGFDDVESQVYEALLRRPGSSARELETLTGVTNVACRRALAGLQEAHLIAQHGTRPATFVPIRPDPVLNDLLGAQEEQLQAARAASSSITEAFKEAAVVERSQPPVEVAGPPTARQRWRQIQRDARDEVVILEKPPYVFVPHGPNPEEMKKLAEGVRYRVLYEAASLEAPGKIEKVRACVEAGEVARVVSRLPLKLIAADRQVGLTYEVAGDRVTDALIVHSSPLLDALFELFELLWSQAVPLRFGDPMDHARIVRRETGSVNSEVLALMTAGLKDEAIARQLHLNVRTVRRKAAAIIDACDARTRFQAGVQAALRGWIDQS
jgi:hypothetical protein